LKSRRRVNSTVGRFWFYETARQLFLKHLVALFHLKSEAILVKETKVVRMDQLSASLLRLPVFLAIALLVLLVSACGSKLAGTFVGGAKVSGGGYGLDEYIGDVTVTLTNKDSTEYYLTFGKNSPLQCKLLLDNMNSEDNNPDNDKDLSFRRIRGDDTCELRDKNGQVQTAKINSISGGRQLDGYLSLDIDLAASPTGFRFSYQGWSK
jgi:hypothetical protein